MKNKAFELFFGAYFFSGALSLLVKSLQPGAELSGSATFTIVAGFLVGLVSVLSLFRPRDEKKPEVCSLYPGVETFYASALLVGSLIAAYFIGLGVWAFYEDGQYLEALQPLCMLMAAFYTTGWASQKGRRKFKEWRVKRSKPGQEPFSLL